MSEETATQFKPKAPEPRPKRVEVGGFGDAPLGGALVEPVPFGHRPRKAWWQAAELVGLALSPAQLALAVVVLPLGTGVRPSVLAMLAGLVAGAVVAVAVQAPLLRYGITLGVLARSAFGWGGARVFSVVRTTALVAFFANAVLLSMKTLYWCVLCAEPSAGGVAQRVTRVGDTSLIVVAATVVVSVALWFPAKKVRARGLLLLPPIALVALLFALPENLPMSAALDLATRAESSNVPSLFAITFAWAASILLAPANETRLQETQAGQTLAVFATILPWLIGSLAMAVAVFSSGGADLTTLACRRLPTPWLIATLCSAALAYVWPIAHITATAVTVHVQELLGRYAKPLPALLIELAFLCGGLAIALVQWSVLTVQLVVLAACLVIAAQYFAVDRMRLVLDDLYSLRGAPMLLPAGWLTLALAAGVWLLTQRLGAALAVAFVAQMVFGNVQRLIRRR